MTDPVAEGDATDGPPGGRRRRSRAELRAEVLDMGVTILEEEGPAAVGFRLEAITFPKVFERILSETGRRIVPAMVYERIWASQEEYQWEVLDELIRRTGYASGSTVDAIVEIIREARRGTAEERRITLLALCRIAGAINIDAALGDREWWTLVAVIGATSSARTTLNDTFVSPAVKQSLRNQTASYSLSYQWILESIGYQVRSGFTVSHFAMLAGALAEGVALRSKFDPDYRAETELTLRADGVVEGWSLFSVGLVALVDQYFEPDPDFDPASELSPPPAIDRRAETSFAR